MSNFHAIPRQLKCHSYLPKLNDKIYSIKDEDESMLIRGSEGVFKKIANFSATIVGEISGSGSDKGLV